MKCPACETHTTSFALLARSEWQFYKMPFIRTCPRCGAEIRFGTLPLACFLGLLFLMHLSIEVSAIISRRWGWDRDNAFISTAIVFAIPFTTGLYFLWKHGRYTRRG